jgi:uncharacterized membrane protein
MKPSQYAAICVAAGKPPDAHAIAKPEGHVVVLIRLLQILEILVGRTADDQRHQALRRQADLIVEAAERSIPSVHDRAPVRVARSRVFPMPDMAGERRKS